MKRLSYLALVVVATIFSTMSVVLAAGLKGEVKVDGSSTVAPISMAMAEEFMGDFPGVRVTVGVSGTGGGFKKFTVGEIQISDASRPVKQKELDAMANNGITCIELPVAYDGIAVLVNPANHWVEYLSTQELKAICEPGSQIDNWNQVRKGFPNQPLNLYVPGADSGTFDYFTEAIVGKSGAHRSDCAAMSEDDNTLVTGIAGDKGGLGYFGFAYFVENRDLLKVVPILHDGKTVTPGPQTINDGSYQPLSRPIFIYVSSEARGLAAVDMFVNFYLENASWLAEEVGYIALPDEVYELGIRHYEDGITGSMFQGVDARVGVDLAEMMAGLSN